MKLSRRISDPALVWLALIATFAGLFFVFDAGYSRSIGQDHGVLPPEFRTQVLFSFVALAGGFICSWVKPETWPKLAKPMFMVCLVLLVLVFKFGHEMNGAKRWIGVGQFTIQPAELAKLGVVLYLAATFYKRKAWPTSIKPRKDWAHWMDTIFVPKLGRILPAVWVLIAVCLIEKEPDLGTGAVIAVTAFAMFIVGGVSRRSLVAAVLVAVVGSWVMVKQEPYRWDRITNHIHRWDPKNVDETSYQTVQSELAIATGGYTGLGVGNGRAKQVIPAPTTDFIMATVGEEFGLAGSMLVLALMAGITWRLVYLGARAPSRFGSLVLYGFGAWIGIQTCVNVMMANGFLPAIGIPLPFISSGGSSLFALWCGVGVCQSLMSAPIPEKSAKRAPTFAVVQAARPEVHA